MRLPAVTAVTVVLIGLAPPAAVAAPTPTPAAPTPAASATSGPGTTVSPPAESPVTWGVTPSSPKGPDGRASLRYKLDPGASVTDYVAVTNHSAGPVTLTVYASDAFTTGQGGFDLLAGREKPVDVGAWVRLPTRTLTVPATSRMDLPFTLTVPANATPGDHTGGIVAALAATGTDAQGNQVSVDHRVGTRVYLRVTGELRPALALEDLRVRHRGSYNPITGGELTVTAMLRNTGNVRLGGQPTLRATGPFGLAARTTTGAPVPEILPGGAVRVSVQLSGVAPLFRLTATTTVTPVTVDGQVIDPPPLSVADSRAVWALPWSQLLLVILTVIGCWVLLRLRRRRRRRTARDLAQAVAAAREQGRIEAAKGIPGSSADEPMNGQNGRAPGAARDATRSPGDSSGDPEK
ncbi:WxL protein peptidoglycan domain-containing protein [Plantactinospora solaniradicis]|uniref:WxL protein peptidoglycan domain-containing protein n=1 Tax=Plantactinospora solaniradicis TaxID=1723736 RepID=A0ABW1K8D5_9ACTN